MSKKELKPCPFCGEMPSARTITLTPYSSTYVVSCENDDCPAKPYILGDDAAEKWNTRKGE